MEQYLNRPYDLSNPHELKKLLVDTVTVYMNCQLNWVNAESVLEDFDETLENSDFSTWFRTVSDPDSVDSLTSDAYSSLKNSGNLLLKIANREQNNLSSVLKTIFATPLDIQKMVLGVDCDVPTEEADNVLEEMYDIIWESGCENWDENLFGVFMDTFNETMKSFRRTE